MKAFKPDHASDIALGAWRALRLRLEGRSSAADRMEIEDLMRRRIGYALMEQANLRFVAWGPDDQRGAAFWDAYCGLVEGTIEIPDSVPEAWGHIEPVQNWTPDEWDDIDPFGTDVDNMCPNCVTPWKCNGPHLTDYSA